jgi:hypothetical protein
MRGETKRNQTHQIQDQTPRLRQIPYQIAAVVK